MAIIRWNGGHALKARKAVLKADKECMVCGADRKLGVHHIVPLSEGGNERAGNLITTCDTCEKQVHKDTFDAIHQGGIALEYPAYRIHNIFLLRELAIGKKKAESKTPRYDYLKRRAIPKLGEHAVHTDKFRKQALNIVYMLDNGLVDKSRLPWTIQIGDFAVEIKEAFDASQ